MNNKYSTMYKMSVTVILNRNKYIRIPSADVVTLSFIHNYDTNTFPIIRLRLYSDLSIIQDMLQFPDSIYVRVSMNGGIYQMDDNLPSPLIVAGVKPISFEMKGYIENKNIPTSVMDQYENGIKKDDSLNNNIKAPIELYCYDESTIHRLKQKVPSIYKNMSLTTVIRDMLTRNNINSFNLETLDNQNKYEQVLIPNLDISDALAFIDMRYGLFKKGAHVYGDFDSLYICDTDVNNGTTPIPIYVRSAKENDDNSGMKLSGGVHKYKMITNAPNVSVITETDVERVLNSPEIGAINLNTLGVDIRELNKLFSDSMELSSARKSSGGISLNNITTPQILHKNANEFVLDAYVARLNERMTRIDVSGSGFDIGEMRINTRYNVIFETAIRGLNINAAYRATYACHVLSNLDGTLFTPTTNLSLCSN